MCHGSTEVIQVEEKSVSGGVLEARHGRGITRQALPVDLEGGISKRYREYRNQCGPYDPELYKRSSCEECYHPEESRCILCGGDL